MRTLDIPPEKIKRSSIDGLLKFRIMNFEEVDPKEIYNVEGVGRFKIIGRWFDGKNTDYDFLEVKE